VKQPNSSRHGHLKGALIYPGAGKILGVIPVLIGFLAAQHLLIAFNKV